MISGHGIDAYNGKMIRFHQPPQLFGNKDSDDYNNFERESQGCGKFKSFMASKLFGS